MANIFMITVLALLASAAAEPLVFGASPFYGPAYSAAYTADVGPFGPFGPYSAAYTAPVVAPVSAVSAVPAVPAVPAVSTLPASYPATFPISALSEFSSFRSGYSVQEGSVPFAAYTPGVPSAPLVLSAYSAPVPYAYASDYLYKR